MVKIYFVRHGEVDNPQGLIYGRLPGFDLSVLGKKQSKQAGSYLLNLKAKPEIIISSPLERTRATARILANFFPKIAIKKEEKIIEGDLGWQGKKEEDLIRKGIWKTYLENPEQIVTGETFFGVQRRIASWLKDFLEKTDFSEFIVVSHKDLIRSLTIFLEGRILNDLSNIPCALASITLVEVNRKMELQKPISYWEPNRA